ncbi:Bifunctional purine biosynthesis protein PurH [Symmachiella macrocystis]|uniref:Bifunctional purine biosynthesis protein PurH n=1 Tax=Symmachiella macrocystis TaxID=2527985 RepID=A0A5C6BLD6_9PLAN|nr:bifunctional phosphoribosylaminoimidazolecarboxamide formyltransferase/IMP cyclohydrolase [Symmachiella macrocystis]TWU12281.1 Bifunctional purine biosynthesis protein PurH [Symmachiella macrocystis]
MSAPRRALVSVSDKTDLVPFISGLVELGFEIISTGGTRRTLHDAGVPVMDISEYTKFPEIMNGRVKTLHPKVHGAILGRPDLADDQAAMAEHEIIPFELVVCNLYPFEETVAREGVTVAEAIEQIDIGGPSMIRSSAKNHAYVGVVTSAAQYDSVLSALKAGPLSEELRRKLAAAAFEMTARYDRAIANYMAGVTAEGDEDAATFPQTLSLDYERRATLRYGENPHQQAAFYVEPRAGESTLAATQQLHGKELSYNNLLDLDAALELVREFTAPAAVVLKHNNPCGAAIGDTLAAAFEAAYAGDPISAFGSIIGFNRPVDLATAEQMCDPGKFVEAIIAPGFDDDAFEALTTRPKWKANVRLMSCPALAEQRPESLATRTVGGGVLVQTRDDRPEDPAQWQVVTERQPTDEERTTLDFAWKICKHVKSNAIVFAKQGAVVGVGAGQMSRLDSAFIAAHKSEGRAEGGVVASDAFFPFRDGVDEAAKAGITAVIQPGGSRRDDEVIAACNEHGMTMIFTGCRHFRH